LPPARQSHQNHIGPENNPRGAPSIRKKPMKKEYDFNQGKRGVVIKAPPGKTRITIRLDNDIIEWFRNQVHEAGGGSYQNSINRALREYILSKPEALADALRVVIREELARYGKFDRKEKKDSPLRIYADTSVIGGCLDPQFQDASVQLMELFRTGKAILVLSDLTLLELGEAPEEVKSVLDYIPGNFREDIELTKNASDLARLYVSAGVISETKWIDAQHIALATYSEVDVLVSWNFKHIVNFERIRGYNSVNRKVGYPLLEIRTPREVVHYDD
jgi:uncharacterized protein (DUF4415 family)